MKNKGKIKSTFIYVLKNLLIGFGALIAVFGLVFLLTSILTKDESTGEIDAFMVVFSIIVTTIGLVMIIFPSSSLKKEKSQKYFGNQNADRKLVLKHIYGLPIPQGMKSEILISSDKISFKSGTTSLSLPKERVTDMCVMTNKEIHHQYVSSVGGAVAGGVLFGPLGAMIGGSSSKKAIKEVTTYYIITYKDKSDNLTYIGFEIVPSLSFSSNINGVNVVVKEFKRANTSTGVHIDL